MHSFFFLDFQLITVLLVICNSYSSLSTRFISVKLCVIFSIFDSLSFLLKLYFCSAKIMDSLILKRHISFHNENNKIATHSFAPRPHMIFHMQQEVWKFIDICVKLELPKKRPEDQLFKLRKSKFWMLHFFSVVTF